MNGSAINIIRSSVEVMYTIFMPNMHGIGMYEQVTMTHTSAKGLEFLKSKWLVK